MLEYRILGNQPEPSLVQASHFFGLNYFDKVVFCKIKNEVDINIASLLQK